MRKYNTAAALATCVRAKQAADYIPKKKSNRFEASEIIAEQEVEHLREIRRLNDVAYTFLRATDGDQVAAEKSLEDCIETLFPAGVFLIWQYRIVLAKIRAGF